MYTAYHPPRRKRAILYHLLAIWGILLPQVTCQTPLPPLDPSAKFATEKDCRNFVEGCMGMFRDCVSKAGPDSPARVACENWREENCEGTRKQCDGLPNLTLAEGGGTPGGGTSGRGRTSSDRSSSVPTSSGTRASKPTSASASSQSDSTPPTPTRASPSSTTPPSTSPTLSSSPAIVITSATTTTASPTIVITSATTTTETPSTGTSTPTTTRTNTATTTTRRRGLKFTRTSNDSTRPWCRTGIGVGLFFWGVVGWAGCLV